MLIGEPSSSSWDLNFSLGGIAVRVHPFFWLMAALLGRGATQNWEPLLLLIWVAVVFVSILVHELGHALAALAHGWHPWITLHGMGGLASYRPTYHRASTQILISLAGPFAGFLLAGAVILVLRAGGFWVQFVFDKHVLIDWVIDPRLYDRSTQLYLAANYLISVNVFWGLMNLLPVLPLDGGRVANELLRQFRGFDGERMALWLSIAVAIAVAAYALIQFDDKYMAILFGYLAYTNYSALAGPFRSGGWR